MFIAHIPSGYIFSTLIVERLREPPASVSAIIAAGVIGALAPDIDMSYFYLIDYRQTHHHKYITHWPMLWLLLALVSAVWFRLSRNPKPAFMSLVFCLAGVLHILLDSFVGDIWWFAPFVDKPFAMFNVPAVFDHWWLNFLLHWSFSVELFICLWALFIYRRRSNHSLQRAALQDTG